jgi:hypothetical protein
MNETCEIILPNNGMIALVDKKNFFYFSINTYRAVRYKKEKTWYVTRHIYIDGIRTTIGMHQEVIQRMNLIVPKGYTIDHKDRDGLNNTEENLHIVTWSESNLNKGLYENNISGIRGVGPAHNDKYYMRYHKNGRRYQKYYNTYEEAVIARLEWEENNLITKEIP